MASTKTPARDAVLVKYLNEAYGKEKQLETNLTALISRAQNHKTLKKGLQDHLKVTKALKGKKISVKVTATSAGSLPVKVVTKVGKIKG